MEHKKIDFFDYLFFYYQGKEVVVSKSKEGKRIDSLLEKYNYEYSNFPDEELVVVYILEIKGSPKEYFINETKKIEVQLNKLERNPLGYVHHRE